MHWWREVYPTSNYPIVILSTPICVIIGNEFPFLLSNIAITTHVKLLLLEENTGKFHSFHLSQSLSHVRLFVTPWTVAHQASLSIWDTQSLFKLMSVELLCYSMMSTLSEIIFFEIPYNWDHIVLFFLWLTLCNVIPSSFFHVAIIGRISFFL